jgi:DNA-binding transcriptional LysR family regulator
MEAVRAGHGNAYVMEDRAMPLLEAGEARRVMESWYHALVGSHLYYPSRRQPTPAFTLLVEALRYRSS